MKSLILIFIGIINIAYSQQIAKDAFVITGNMMDLPDNTTINIYHPMSNTVVATTTSKNKKFIAKGTATFAGLGRVEFKGDKTDKSYDLFFGAEKITIKGTLKDLKNIVLTGAKHQSTFKKFVSTFEPEFKALNEINQNSQKVANDPVAAKKFEEQFNARKLIVGKKMNTFLTSANKSPVASFALYVTKDLFMEDPAAINESLESLKGDAVSSVYYEALQKEIESKLFGSLGSKAVDFSQPDTAGKMVTLSSFKGKYVLLDFWASWCGPCRMENPNVVSAFNKFKSKNFTVLGVSLDRPGKKDDWVNAIAADNLTWTHVSDLKFWQNEVAQMYKVQSIPQNYLIDPNGKIVGKNLRGEALEAKLCELLGCN